MKLALNDAGHQPADISYINAHGTSTPLNDKSETLAIKSVFGETAYKVPISSTKSMTGHLMGASGSLEAAICVELFKHDLLPPTINYETQDPVCVLDYVPNQARPAHLFAEVEDRDDVRVVEACRGLGLAVEALAQLVVDAEGTRRSS